MSDYLSEEEQLDQLKKWWQENGTFLLVGVVLVVGGFLGWRWYDGYTAEQATVASDLYEQYVSAEDSEKLILLERLSADSEGSTYHAFALFAEAAKAVEDGDLETAATHYERVVEVGNEPLIVDLARLRLAGVLHGIDRSDEGLTHLGAIRNDGYRRLALEMKGDIHQAQGDTKLAHEAYVQALADVDNPTQEAPLLLAKKVNTDVEVAAPPVPVEETVQEAVEEVVEEAVDNAAADSDGAVDDAAEDSDETSAANTEAEPQTDEETDDGE